VNKIFENNNLINKKKTKAVPNTVCHKYGTTKPLMMVYTDLHMIKPDYFIVANGTLFPTVYKYIIAFLDDKTRAILHWGFLQDKTSQGTA
jgi:hypothetical protein